MSLRASDLYSEPVIVGTAAELAEALGQTAPGDPVGLGYIPRRRQLIEESDTGTRYVGDDVTPFGSLTPLPGGGDSLPIADPTGVTDGTADNTIKGSGTYAWKKFPADTAVMAWGLEGDDFPRVVFGADPTDYGVVLVGDGTVDPASGDGSGISLSSGVLIFTSPSGIRLSSATEIGGDATFATSHGPVIRDQSDGHTYRLISTNGVASLDQVDT